MRITKFPVILLGAFSFLFSTVLQAAPAAGPLRVHPENSRYFTDGTLDANGAPRAVYLTGAHTWNNLVDIGQNDPPEPFDFGVYLNFLQRHHHNFIRLWTWDSTLWDTRASPRGKDFVHNVAPMPWRRTGPGLALDGKPKFDLSQFNPAYFKRLRQRVVDAGKRGIYVSVMLFEGWGLMYGNRSPKLREDGWTWRRLKRFIRGDRRRRQQEDGWAWRSHPFNPSNNINEIEISGAEELSGRVHVLGNEAANEFQASYIRHVVDTVNDLDNVLYEVINEGGEKEWDWWVASTDSGVRTNQT